ncbi:hypothetical protein J7E73_22615 [Paenibacillus albidus]|uniref:hypothetical protein n=1 Tax=Paenibacillus albidus TaxID=2041023 RepID=UPI001BEBBE52|nr:hypothetical protein [Paenibacillus albidus]MBT2291867.1 hypothetical protein [Paenibacillus albidus]
MAWRGRTLMIAGLVLVLLLSGCAKGTAQVTVNNNGSIDIAANVHLNAKAESLLGGRIDELLTDRLQQKGIELQKTQDGKAADYQIMKSYASIEEIKALSGNWDIVNSRVKTTDSLFYTKYDIETQLKINAYTDQIIESIGSLSIPESLVRMLINSFSFDFKLTLPFDLYGANNAAEQDGRTLTWHIALAGTEPVQLVVYVPQIRNIAIAGGLVILVLTVAAVFWAKSRRSKKRKG